MEILVVEDEAGIADFLERGLRAEGYEVRLADDGDTGARLALDPEVDLVVLDRMLPGLDGLEVLERVRRARPALPVIMLTAKAEVADRVEGLDGGATDYLTKPFVFEELLARIRARIRDGRGRSETVLEAAGIRLDLLAREAQREDIVTRLPERESDLLAYLMRNDGRVATREDLLAAVWGYRHDPGTNIVRVYEDAQSDVEKTFVAVGALALVAALLAGFLVAARSAAPLQRFAGTATAVDAGDLSPRIATEPGAAAELRTLADSFNHMLDRLEDAFARQRTFVSDASHELRSPLTAIRGQIEVLGREPDPDAAAVKRVEATTLAELARVERLVEELLALARLDEGAGPARRELDAARFLREAVEAAPGEAVVGPVAAGRLDADPEMVARVLRNLIENARRHGGPRGTVAVSSTAAGEHLLIEVDDDGPGIPLTEREPIFDRFHRSDTGRARAAGGSGLGLAIARSVVEAHGGKISASESPLGGARIAFELPRYRSPGGA
jgi:DNA-binding response OmpR family regulator/HAMP domain-containing protein